VSIEIGGIKSQHIGRQLKALDRRAGDRDLGLLQIDIGDLSGQSMKSLARECRRRQTRHARQTALQKTMQMTLGGGPAGPLEGHPEHHFPNRRPAPRSWQAARLVDEFDQVELLGEPDQGANITNPLPADDPRRSQVGYRGRVGGAQHGLSGEWPLLTGVPERLGRDPVTSPTLRSNIFILSSRGLVTRKSQAKPAIHRPSSALGSVLWSQMCGSLSAVSETLRRVGA
jgi:hypothetical protein